MPDVGRFFNVDPLSEKYSYQSHYNFSENRVVNARELEGLEAWVVNGREMTNAMPGWKTDARAVGFGLRHPIAASQIGTVASGSTNISSVAGRFARHFADGTGTSKDIGSPSNALRHGLWSAMIRSEFDAGISKRATNAHEGVGIGESQYVDMSKPFTGTGTDGANLADHIVDVLNNNIGMGIAEANPNANTKDLVSAVLGEFKNNGLWTFSTDKDGNVSITRSKLTDSQYNTAVKTVNSLNSNGFSKDEQQKIDDQTRKSQEAMKSMGQSAGW